MMAISKVWRQAAASIVCESSLEPCVYEMQPGHSGAHTIVTGGSQILPEAH